MLIILEGCDRTGKSTLAAELARLTGGTVIHAGCPTRPPREEYLSPLSDYTPGGGQTIILDRWHWGEMVWPKVFGRETEMTPKIFDEIDLELYELGAVAVYCERQDFRTWVRDLRDNNEPIGADQLFDALDLYARVERRAKTSCFWYDWPAEDGGNICYRVLETARAAEDDSEPRG